MTQVFNYDELANSPSLFSIGGNVVEYVSESTCLGKTFSNKDQGSFTDLPVSMILILAGIREDTHAVWWLGCLSSALLEKMAKDFTR